MRNLLSVVLVFVLVAGLNGQVVINEVLNDAVGTDTGKEWIELFNNTNNPIDLSGYDLTARLSGGDYTFGSFVLTAKSYVIIYWNKDGTNTVNSLYTGDTGFDNISDSKGSVALFSSTSHTSSTIIDFVQWGEGGQIFESSAVSAGIWTEGDCIAKVAAGHSMEYDGSGNLSTDFIDQANPTPGGDNSLPVELSSFSAQQNGSAVEIKWTTQSELNNSGFYVLRSENETEGYQKISALISGAGSSSEKHSYTFTDKRIEPNRSYFYQLQQVDMDGTIESFGPIEVVIQKQDKSLYELPEKSKLVCNYPNPFNPGTTFYIAQKETEEVAISVYDLMGRKINSLYAGTLDSGHHELPWNGMDQNGMQAPSGHYFVKMHSASGKISVLKVLKLQ